jgi:hypothetical protein
MKVHPQGPRPRDFFGPEDSDGDSDPVELNAEVARRQQVWDAAFHAMPWWRRALSHVMGETSS